MKATHAHILSKSTIITRTNVNAQFNALIEIIKVLSHVGYYQLDKSHLYPANVEKAICLKLQNLGYKVKSNELGHITQIKW
jgi:ABC-type transporter Mla maintaining outer membrane lipid asymmetry ATPase subunit MlaF